jgi:hypothetical protein
MTEGRPRPITNLAVPMMLTASSIEELPECLIVRDANGHALADVYFEEEPGRRSAAKLLTYNEARRIAANIAKLPSPFGGMLSERHCHDSPSPIGYSLLIISNSLRLKMSLHPSAL